MNISVRHLRKTYPTRFGEKLVLDDVNFDLAMGERMGILGRNGAGKSTMVRLISGAEKPTSGSITRAMSVSWPLAFGGAFQPNLTGIDNIRFITNIYAQDFARNLAFVEDFAELGPYLREPVRTYSSGMRARLAFAISMIIEFDCFLIDEIGAVGDARFHERCNYELFDKRGDRAMILISHDAAYIREHCTRFAVLHDARLALFDDFDAAYGNFRDVIGLAPVADQRGEGAAQAYLPSDRGKLVQMAQIEAMRDSSFKLLVQDGDRYRDAQEWRAAGRAYDAALKLYPFERSYWVQAGHAAKEGGQFARAEIAYRTALAHGEPMRDVREHLAFAIARQNDGSSGGDNSRIAAPIHEYAPGLAPAQLPGAADADLFARALWLTHTVPDSEILSLLQCHPTCDGLMAAMIGDARFMRAHGSWAGQPWSARTTSSTTSSNTSTGTGTGTSTRSTHPDWIRDFACITLPSKRGAKAEGALRDIASERDVLPAVIAAGGLADWPLTIAALEAASRPARRAATAR